MPRWDGLTREQQFWAKVRKTETCWLWIAGRFENGYGAFKWNGRLQKAHRVAWELAHGPVPAGMCICHRCDVKLCVRWDHFFLGTQVENIADRNRKGRQARGATVIGNRRSYRGEQHPGARLTASDVLRARELKRQGVQYKELAKMFGVGRGTIEKAVRGETWSHL